MKPLFAYGILQFDDVLEALLGHEVFSIGVDLKGYQRFKKPSPDGIVRGPGIAVSEGGYISGVLLYNLSVGDMTIIDALERGYDRIPVIVYAFGDHPLEAEVYVPKDIAQYTGEPWDEREFRTSGLAHYMDTRIPELLAELSVTH